MQNHGQFKERLNAHDLKLVLDGARGGLAGLQIFGLGSCRLGAGSILDLEMRAVAVPGLSKAIDIG